MPEILSWRSVAPFKTVEELALWFLEEPIRLNYLDEKGGALALAESLDIPVEAAKAIRADEAVYKSLNRRIFMSKATPSRMAGIYERLLSRIEGADKDRLADVTAAIKFLEEQIGNRTPLQIEGKVEHAHRFVEVSYGSQVSQELKKYVGGAEVIEAEILNTESVRP